MGYGLQFEKYHLNERVQPLLLFGLLGKISVLYNVYTEFVDLASLFLAVLWFFALSWAMCSNLRNTACMTEHNHYSYWVCSGNFRVVHLH